MQRLGEKVEIQNCQTFGAILIIYEEIKHIRTLETGVIPETKRFLWTVWCSVCQMPDPTRVNRAASHAGAHWNVITPTRGQGNKASSQMNILLSRCEGNTPWQWLLEEATAPLAAAGRESCLITAVTTAAPSQQNISLTGMKMSHKLLSRPSAHKAENGSGTMLPNWCVTISLGTSL